MTIGNAEQTSIQSYKLVYTGDGADTVPVTWPIGETSGDIDLHLPEWGCKGDETKSNRLCFLFLANAVGTADLVMMGACQGGPKEHICSLALSAGGGVETGANRWVNIIVVTHEHLAECSILAAGEAGVLNSPAKFGFDAIGYQFISFYTSKFVGVGMSSLKVYARYF